MTMVYLYIHERLYYMHTPSATVGNFFKNSLLFLFNVINIFVIPLLLDFVSHIMQIHKKYLLSVTNTHTVSGHTHTVAHTCTHT